MVYLTATQAAERLGVSEKTVRRWIAQGKLTAFHRYQNRLAITEQDVEQKKRELEEYTQPGPGPAEQQKPAAASEDIEKRLKSAEIWIHDLQRWQSELEARIEALESKASILPLQKHTEQSTRTRTPKAAIPPVEGAMEYWQFAKIHQVHRITFRDQIVKGSKRSGERVEAMRIGDKLWLTPDQQKAALEFWKRHNVPFTLPLDQDQEETTLSNEQETASSVSVE